MGTRGKVQIQEEHGYRREALDLKVGIGHRSPNRGHPGTLTGTWQCVIMLTTQPEAGLGALTVSHLGK